MKRTLGFAAVAGARGETGPAGPTRPAGPQGLAGAAGVQGDTLVGSSGPAGSSGVAGAQGGSGLSGPQGTATAGLAGVVGRPSVAGVQGPRGPRALKARSALLPIGPRIAITVSTLAGRISSLRTRTQPRKSRPIWSEIPCSRSRLTASGIRVRPMLTAKI